MQSIQTETFSVGVWSRCSQCQKVAGEMAGCSTDAVRLQQNFCHRSCCVFLEQCMFWCLRNEAGDGHFQTAWWMSSARVLGELAGGSPSSFQLGPRMISENFYSFNISMRFGALRCILVTNNHPSIPASEAIMASVARPAVRILVTTPVGFFLTSQFFVVCGHHRLRQRDRRLRELDRGDAWGRPAVILSEYLWRV